MKIKEKLRDSLKDLIPLHLLRFLPSRYPIIGSAILVRLNPALLPYGSLIGEKLLEYIPRTKSVWAILDTKRIIRRPHVIHLAGNKNPLVQHRELNTIFELDISKITFSIGNRYERTRLLRIIDKKATILDMFACIGNLSLPLAVNNKNKIYTIEINPLAYRFLLRNIVLNKVNDRVIPIHGNNMLFPRKNFVDHVLLGYLPAPNIEQIAVAIRSLKKWGTLHLHKLVERNKEKRDIEAIHSLLNDKFDAEIDSISFDIVKSYSPKYNHVVYRISINKFND